MKEQQQSAWDMTGSTEGNGATKPAAPRFYWMDRLKCFMTVSVILFHTLGTYTFPSEVLMWTGQPQSADQPLEVLWDYWALATQVGHCKMCVGNANAQRCLRP